MYEGLEYEFNLFKKDVDNGETFCRYFDEDDYEDEYSHNEIHEFQSRFIDMAKEYLHKEAPNRYIITSGWCVFVMSIEEAKRRNMKRIDNYIVK